MLDAVSPRSLSKIKDQDLQISDGHSNAIFDLFIETSLFHLLILFFKAFLACQVSLDKNNLTFYQKYHRFCLLNISTDR